MQFGHIADITRYNAVKHTNLIAFLFEGRETSYGELDKRASQTANGLIALGTSVDDRVAYLAKNMDTFYELLFGAIKARACLTGINNRLAPPEIAYVINDSGASTLFVSEEFFPQIEQIRGDCPNLRNVIVIEGEHSEWPSYEGWREGQSDIDPKLDHDVHDDVIQLYTSGTTGFPKGVQLTSENYLAYLNSAFSLEWAAYDPGDVVMNCMPLFHVAGVNVGMVGAARGAKTIIIRDIDPQLILNIVQDEKVQHTVWVPAVILLLTIQPNVREFDFSKLENIVYGASPIAEDLLLKAVDIMGCKFHQVYGLTETVGGATWLPPEAHDPSWNKLRSCGAPVPGAMIRTLDGEGNVTPVGEVGEICIKAPFVMKGYWNKQDATNDAVKDGWFFTGDAGYFDDDGFLYIYDRVKDMIVSGGENVYPAEVENALFSHPDVADVAVIGVPSEKWGEEVKAIVVRAPDTNLAGDDLIAFAKEKIAGYKVPKTVDFISELPRNPSGKVLRKDLREPYWKDVERRVG